MDIFSGKLGSLVLLLVMLGGVQPASGSDPGVEAQDARRHYRGGVEKVSLELAGIVGVYFRQGDTASVYQAQLHLHVLNVMAIGVGYYHLSVPHGTMRLVQTGLDPQGAPAYKSFPADLSSNGLALTFEINPLDIGGFGLVSSVSMLLGPGIRPSYTVDLGARIPIGRWLRISPRASYGLFSPSSAGLPSTPATVKGWGFAVYLSVVPVVGW